MMRSPPPARGPLARRQGGLAYNPRRERLILVGGFEAGGIGQLADLWEWDGDRWDEISAEGPGGRPGINAVYDDARGELVIFGGGFPAPKDDLTWTYAMIGGPCTSSGDCDGGYVCREESCTAP